MHVRVAFSVNGTSSQVRIFGIVGLGLESRAVSRSGSRVAPGPEEMRSARLLIRLLLLFVH